jgi:CspA family cold shock protein
MPIGTVKWFSGQKGYGFIAPEEGGDDAFVHITALQESGIASLDEGQKVEYELVAGRNGKMAAQNLRLVD